MRCLTLVSSPCDSDPCLFHHFRPVINSLALLAWIFSKQGTFHCSFIMIEMINAITNETTSDTEEQVVDHPVGLGLFSTSVYDMDANLLGCVSYYGTSDEFDGAFRAARTFGLMTFLSISIALVCVLLVTLFIEPRSIKAKLWKVARFLFGRRFPDVDLTTKSLKEIKL